jgi:UDP-N-acetylmuramate--alanine ligase
LARAGLGRFAGTARRFEERGRAGAVRVLDDYAHHPTEIAATLAAARAEAGGGRVLVVFQPHLYSRTRQFAPEFAQALAAADRVWLLDIYGARERPQPGVTSALIGDSMNPAPEVAGGARRADVVAAVAAEARPGDTVITMGAGDVTDLGAPIVAALEERWG